MSYVPPHKRSVGRENNRVAAPHRFTDSDPNGRRKDRSSIHDDIARSTRLERSDTREQTEDKDSNRANEIYFCAAFSFIRCINLAQRPQQWEQFHDHCRRIGPEFWNKVVRFDAVDGQEAVRQAQGVPLAASGDVVEDGNSARKAAAAAAESSLRLDPTGRIGIEVAWEWDPTQNSLWDRHVAPGIIRQMTPGEIGCALSHISLWKELAKKEPEDCDSTIVNSGSIQNLQPLSLSMMIFEDDASFLKQSRRRHTKRGTPTPDKSADRFLNAFRTAHKILPGDWDIFYLGFSDRGERKDVRSGRTAGNYEEGEEEEDDLVVQIFKPTYGFHTHAYVINQSAASRLLQNLPVVGPIDVWLADHQWFGLNVYCAIVANEGWKNTGAPLVGQDRSIAITSSVGHSGR